MKVIIYHDDNDGRLSAAIMLKKLKQESDPLSVVCIPATYDRAEAIVKGVATGDEVYMLDFSVSSDQFEELIRKSKFLAWIDHHKTAIEAVDKRAQALVPGLRSTEKAACLLTWEYCFPKEEAPLAVKLVADRDAWKWEFGQQTAEFHYGLATHYTHPNAGVWDVLLTSAVGTHKIQSDGRLALKTIGQRFKEIREAVAFDTEIDGYKARAMNIAIAGSAAFGAEGWETGALPKDVDICCQYYHNGSVFTVSMYSETVDVSELCKKRGGGGHKGAAGFTCRNLPDFLRKE